MARWWTSMSCVVPAWPLPLRRLEIKPTRSKRFKMLQNAVWCTGTRPQRAMYDWYAFSTPP